MAFIINAVSGVTEYTLEQNAPLLIGRGENAKIKINDKRCSKEQAEITYFYDSANGRGRALLKAKGTNPVIIDRKGTIEHLFRDHQTILENEDKFSMLFPNDYSFILKIDPSEVPKPKTSGSDTEEDESTQRIRDSEKIKGDSSDGEQSKPSSHLPTSTSYKPAPNKIVIPIDEDNNSPTKRKLSFDEHPSQINSPINSQHKKHNVDLTNDNSITTSNISNISPPKPAHYVHPLLNSVNSAKSEFLAKFKKSKLESPLKDPNSNGTSNPLASKSPQSNPFMRADYIPPPQKGQKPLPVGEAHCLVGKVFLVTGILDSLEREEAYSLIVRYGGKVVKSICKSLTHIIIGEEYGAKKAEQAKKMGDSISIIDEDGLFKLIETSKAPEGYKTPKKPKVVPSINNANNISNNTSPGPSKPPHSSPNNKSTPSTNNSTASRIFFKEDISYFPALKKTYNCNTCGSKFDSDPALMAHLATHNSPARPSCMYGGACYRKNPEHKKQFSHPGDPDYVSSE